MSESTQGDPVPVAGAMRRRVVFFAASITAAVGLVAAVAATGSRNAGPVRVSAGAEGEDSSATAIVPDSSATTVSDDAATSTTEPPTTTSDPGVTSTTAGDDDRGTVEAVADAPECRDSYDPGCGPFYWDPAPAPNQPLVLEIVSVSDTTPDVGQEIEVVVHAFDPDASSVYGCGENWGDGQASVCCVGSPSGMYGPWTPPAAQAGDTTFTSSHSYESPGTYTVSLGATSFSGEWYGPYGGQESVQVVITVSDPASPEPPSTTAAPTTTPPGTTAPPTTSPTTTSTTTTSPATTAPPTTASPTTTTTT